MNEKRPYNKIAFANTPNLSKQKKILYAYTFFLSVIILIVITYQVFYKKNNTFDYWAFNVISTYVTNARTEVILFFTILGSHKFLIPAWFALAFLYYFLYKEKLGAAKILSIGIFNLIIMFTLKFLFNRPRPEMPLLSQVSGLSFPSGHAFMGFTFFSIIIYFVHRDIKNLFIKYALVLVLVFTIIMIGFSRIYLRLHYTTDVIAGYCFGVLSFLFFYYIQNILHFKINSP